MTNAMLLAPALLAAGLFSTQASAHDVVLSAAVPGFSIVIGTPPPPPTVVYYEPPPPPVVYYEPPPPPVVYYEPAYRPVYHSAVSYRPRVLVDHRCDRPGFHVSRDDRAYRDARFDPRHDVDHRGRDDKRDNGRKHHGRR